MLSSLSDITIDLVNDLIVTFINDITCTVTVYFKVNTNIILTVQKHTVAIIISDYYH